MNNIPNKKEKCKNMQYKTSHIQSCYLEMDCYDVI